MKEINTLELVIHLFKGELVIHTNKIDSSNLKSGVPFILDMGDKQLHYENKIIIKPYYRRTYGDHVKVFAVQLKETNND